NFWSDVRDVWLCAERSRAVRDLCRSGAHILAGIENCFARGHPAGDVASRALLAGASVGAASPNCGPGGRGPVPGGWAIAAAAPRRGIYAQTRGGQPVGSRNAAARYFLRIFPPDIA